MYTNIDQNKPVAELAGALQSFKWPTHRHRTTTLPIIRKYMASLA